jgi:SET and MYND domain-containing protein
MTPAQRLAWQGQGTHAQECPALEALLAQRGVTPPPSLRLAHRLLLKRAQPQLAAPPWDAPALAAALQSHRSSASEAQLISTAQAAAALSAYASVDAQEATDVLLALSCNAHSVCDAELRPTGKGVYPVVATANHDCAPSACLTFRGATTQLRSVRSLSAGEEVTLSYIDLCACASERRAELREGYFFECQCARCAAAFAPGGCEEDRAMGGCGCASCGAATAPLATVCGACGAQVAPQPADVRRARTDAAEAIAEARRARSAGDVVAAAAAAARALTAVRASRLPPTAALRTRALDECLKAALEAEDWTGALSAAADSLPGYTLCHGAGGASPLLGLQHATVAKLRWALGDAQEAGRQFQRASAHLEVTHGGDHPLVRELQQSAREAQAQDAHASHGRRLE